MSVAAAPVIARPEIPIRNLFYMLCYAWGVLEETADGVTVPSGEEEHTSLVNLFASLLVREVRRILQRGAHQGYHARSEATTRLRGRIQFNTLAAVGMRSAFVPCVFDDLTPDTLHNQILAATLERLRCTEDLDRATLTPAVVGLCQRFREITSIGLRPGCFRDLEKGRQVREYQLALRLCRLLYRHLLPTEADEAQRRFRAFERDDAGMRRVFERFVREFFRVHGVGRFRVEPRSLVSHWVPDTRDIRSRDVTPAMRTDVYLESQVAGRRNVLIECKYTSRLMTRTPHRDAKWTLRSAHLYQLNAYLDALDAAGHTRDAALLLYPLNREKIDAHFTYQYREHDIHIRTINLDQDWFGVERDLLAMTASV